MRKIWAKIWTWLNEKLVSLAIFATVPRGKRQPPKVRSHSPKMVLTRAKHLLTGRHAWVETDLRSETTALSYTVVVPCPPQPPHFEDVQYGYFRLEICACGAENFKRVRTSWQGKQLEIKQEEATR